MPRRNPGIRGVSGMATSSSTGQTDREPAKRIVCDDCGSLKTRRPRWSARQGSAFSGGWNRRVWRESSEPASVTVMVRGEIFNSVTHLMGSLFAVAGLVVLLAAGVRTGDPWKLGSFAVYGAALVALYLFSTLYHSLDGRPKRIFRKLDHTSIYVLIAGTYTPFSLVALRGPVGYWLLATVWTLAAVGILQEFLLRTRNEALSVSLYLFMGWLAIVAFLPLLHAIGWAGMAWLLAGGILYTAGVFFYLVDEKYAHSHGVFHLFVLGGSMLHFLVVLRFLA